TFDKVEHVVGRSPANVTIGGHGPGTRMSPPLGGGGGTSRRALSGNSFVKHSLQRHDESHTNQAIPIVGGLGERGGTAVQEIQREMDVAGERTFAADLGEVRRLGAGALDILLAPGEGAAPY